jgi:hypothetical protein
MKIIRFCNNSGNIFYSMHYSVTITWKVYNNVDIGIHACVIPNSTILTYIIH